MVGLYTVITTNAQAHMLLVYIGSSITTFLLAFAKAFQSRNIVLGHYKSAYGMSWVVTTLEVASVSFVVIGGWWVILSAGFGGSIGVIAAMRAHEKIFTSVQPK